MFHFGSITFTSKLLWRAFIISKFALNPQDFFSSLANLDSLRTDLEELEESRWIQVNSRAEKPYAWTIIHQIPLEKKKNSPIISRSDTMISHLGSRYILNIYRAYMHIFYTRLLYIVDKTASKKCKLLFHVSGDWEYKFWGKPVLIWGMW